MPQEQIEALNYNHGEAFCLMKYANKSGTIVEWLWNSRDGVTPFGILSKDAPELPSDHSQFQAWTDQWSLFHCDWQLDRRMPYYKPLPGERIFVDYTLEMAVESRTKFVDRYWDHESLQMDEHYDSKADAIERLSRGDMEQEGQPGVIFAKDWKDPRPPIHPQGRSGLDFPRPRRG